MTIAISQDKTTATIHYPTGKTIQLYHSQGLVVDLVMFLLLPSCPKDVTLGRLLTSLEDTAELAMVLNQDGSK